MPQSFVSPSYTPIQIGFTLIAQHIPHLLTGTPLSTDLSASYSELTGQPTPTQSIALTTTSEVSASEIVAPLVTGTGTGTIETVPLSIASTDPPTTGTLQAQVTETASLMATTSTALPTEPQGQAVATATALEL
jgi:hypothetical protein